MEDIDERSFRASFFFFLSRPLGTEREYGKSMEKGEREKEGEREVGQREEKIEMGIRG